MKMRIAYAALGIILVSALIYGFYRRQNMPLNTIPFNGMGHSLSFSPDGKTLSLCTGFGVILYDTASWKQKQFLKGHTDYSYWTPNNHLLTFGISIVDLGNPRCHDNLDLTTWDVAKGTIVHRTVLPNYSIDAISPDLAMAALSYKGTGEIVSTSTGRSLHDFPNQGFFEPQFSPDNHYFASATGAMDKPGPVLVWNTRTWQRIAGPQAHKVQGCCLRFSPNGRILAVGTPKAVTLWNTTTWQAVQVLPARFKYLFRLRFSSDGTQLAGGGRSESEDKLPNFSWTLWNMKTGKDIYERHYTYFYGFMPGSNIIITDDGVEKLASFSLWDGGKGRELWSSSGKISFDNHWPPDIQAALSPNHKTIATATSYDPNMGSLSGEKKPKNVLQIWNMPN